MVTATRILASRLYYAAAFEALGDDANGSYVSVQPLGQRTSSRSRPPRRTPSRPRASPTATRVRRRRAQRALPEGASAPHQAAAPPDRRLPEFTARGQLRVSRPAAEARRLPHRRGHVQPDRAGAGAGEHPLRPRVATTEAQHRSSAVGGAPRGRCDRPAARVRQPAHHEREDLQLEHRLPILARIPRLEQGRAWLPHRVARSCRALSGRATACFAPCSAASVPTAATALDPRHERLARDAKTTTAVNLAITLAASNLGVVLVDGDLHRPMVSCLQHPHRSRRAEPRPREPRRAGSGDRARAKPPSSPAAPLQSGGVRAAGLRNERFRRLIDELTDIADVVVVDSPPVPEVAEVLEMATAVDAVVVCVRLGRTRRDKLAELREMLGRRDVSPVGFVVTTRSASVARRSTTTRATCLLLRTSRSSTRARVPGRIRRRSASATF